jgi:hypothetical protein
MCCNYGNGGADQSGPADCITIPGAYKGMVGGAATPTRPGASRLCGRRAGLVSANNKKVAATVCSKYNELNRYMYSTQTDKQFCRGRRVG